MSGKEEVRRDLIAGFRDQKLASGIAPCPDKVPNLVVTRVTFHDNHVVECDTLGDFPKPEWDLDRAPEQQAPVCYVRGATVRLTVELHVLGTRSYEGSVTIQGSARFGEVELTWKQDVTLAPGEAKVTLSQVAASAPLPDHVGCYDPVVIIWEARAPGKARIPTGETQHVFYALLGAPIAICYWTCVDISCRWGHGATAESALVEQVFNAFRTRKLTRKRDGVGLTYWRPGLAWADSTRCVAVSCWLLLNGRHGRGQCGSWAELLVTTYGVHGVAAKKQVVLPRTEAPFFGGGIAVKRWRYITPPATSKTAYTHNLGGDCVDEPGVPGQRNPNPPGAFMLHFIAKVAGQYYDPSYGAGPFPDELSWQRASIDGLVAGAPQLHNVGFAEAETGYVVFVPRDPAPASYNVPIFEAD